jgi:hypothetical protein
MQEFTNPSVSCPRWVGVVFGWGWETPAMASGLEDHVWLIHELIEQSATF